MNITESLNNGSRGVMDVDLNGRYDLPIYKTGNEVFENFITNYKGNKIYRTGMGMLFPFEDCAIIEFKFNFAQNYLLLFTDLKVRFATYDINGNFVLVEDGTGVVEVATPYSLQEAKELKFTQDADLMYLVHPQHEPRTLKRTSANSFVLEKPTITGAGFDDPTTGTVGYPSCVSFYRGRLFYGGATKAITTIWGSEVGDYNNFAIPDTGIVATDPIKITLTDISEQIEWLFPGEGSLMAGSRDGLVPINGGSHNQVITSENVDANISSIDGSNDTTPIVKDGNVFYIGKNGRYVHWYRYDVLSESFRAQNVNVTSYDITRGKIKSIKYKKDRDDLIFCVTEDGYLLTLNFNEGENIAGWHKHKTNGDVVEIAQITNNNGDSQIILLVKRGDSYFIEKVYDFVEFSLMNEFYTGNKDKDEEAYRRIIAEDLRKCNYLDNSSLYSGLKDVRLVYSVDTVTADSSVFSSDMIGRNIEIKTLTGYEYGRLEITEFVDDKNVKVRELLTPNITEWNEWYLTFNKITGLERFNGKEISIVDDGGYYEQDVVVSNGEIELDTEMSVAVVGYKYTGVIKSFILGFPFNNGDNTQKTNKIVREFHVRAVNTAGGKVGTDRYSLTDLQEFSTKKSFNYLPTDLINGTISRVISDTSEVDKHLYLIQDKPLPMNVTAMLVDVDYGTLKS